MNDANTLVINQQTLQALSQELELKDAELRILRAENSCFLQQIIDYESRLDSVNAIEVETYQQEEKITALQNELEGQKCYIDVLIKHHRSTEDRLKDKLAICEKRYDAILGKLDAGICKINNSLETMKQPKWRKLLTRIKYAFMNH